LVFEVKFSIGGLHLISFILIGVKTVVELPALISFWLSPLYFSSCCPVLIAALSLIEILVCFFLSSLYLLTALPLSIRIPTSPVGGSSVWLSGDPSSGVSESLLTS
jgi:hypothetical protein